MGFPEIEFENFKTLDMSRKDISSLETTSGRTNRGKAWIQNRPSKRLGKEIGGSMVSEKDLRFER